MGGVGVGLLTTLGVGVGFFCPTPTPDVQLNHFYIRLLNREFLLKWYNTFETFVETEFSCCIPRFPLILTAKFHSLCVKESELEILERSEMLESRSRKFRKVAGGSRTFYLRLINPDFNLQLSRITEQ